MMRSGTETAIGGAMLGMALPLVTFGVVLAAGQASVVGLSDAPLVIPFGALIVLSAMLLGAAGSTLLWWQKLPAPRPALKRARRRELPRPRITAPVVFVRPKAAAPRRPAVAPQVGYVTTELVPFAGTQRRVRITARA